MEADEIGNIITSKPHGQCFAVHNRDVFAKEVLPLSSVSLAWIAVEKSLFDRGDFSNSILTPFFADGFDSPSIQPSNANWISTDSNASLQENILCSHLVWNVGYSLRRDTNGWVDWFYFSWTTGPDKGPSSRTLSPRETLTRISYPSNQVQEFVALPLHDPFVLYFFKAPSSSFTSTWQIYLLFHAFCSPRRATRFKEGEVRIITI